MKVSGRLVITIVLADAEAEQLTEEIARGTFRRTLLSALGDRLTRVIRDRKNDEEEEYYDNDE